MDGWTDGWIKLLYDSAFRAHLNHSRILFILQVARRLQRIILTWDSCAFIHFVNVFLCKSSLSPGEERWSGPVSECFISTISFHFIYCCFVKNGEQWIDIMRVIVDSNKSTFLCSESFGCYYRDAILCMSMLLVFSKHTYNGITIYNTSHHVSFAQFFFTIFFAMEL